MNNDGYILVTNNIFNNMAVSFANTNAIPDMHLTAQTPIGYVQVPNLPLRTPIRMGWFTRLASGRMSIPETAQVGLLCYHPPDSKSQMLLFFELE